MTRSSASVLADRSSASNCLIFVNEDTEVTNFGEHLLRRVVEEHFYDLIARPRVLLGKHVPGIGLNQVYEQNEVPQLALAVIPRAEGRQAHACETQRRSRRCGVRSTRAAIELPVRSQAHRATPRTARHSVPK